MTTRLESKENVSEKKPAQYPGLEEALDFAFQADIEIGERDGELVIKDTNRKMQKWLRDTLIANKAQIIRQIAMGRKVTFLYDRIAHLCTHESAFKGLTRQESIDRIDRYIEAFAAECDLPEGYTAVGDAWAETALTALRNLTPPAP